MDFLWAMEDILETYERPYDPHYPVLCVDERPCVLHNDIVVPLPMSPGQTRRLDYEYERKGVAVVFLAVDIHRGYRRIEVRQHRTRADYAEFMNNLQKEYRQARKLIIVQDNLNTHTPGSFYTQYDAQSAFSLAQRFEMHYTPKKGSWLNMAEIELSALARQCLNRRLGNIQTLAREVEAWAKSRNQKAIGLNWKFSKNNARDKFRNHYTALLN